MCSYVFYKLKYLYIYDDIVSFINDMTRILFYTNFENEQHFFNTLYVYIELLTSIILRKTLFLNIKIYFPKLSCCKYFH